MEKYIEKKCDLISNDNLYDIVERKNIRLIQKFESWFNDRSDIFQAIVIFSGVFVFFMLYAFFQELLFKNEGFEYGWFLSLFQFAIYGFYGFINYSLQWDEGTRRRCPLSIYFLLSLLMVATFGFSNSACSYLNYPTQALFKASKLVPVMIGGIILLGKRFALFDYFSAFLLISGLVTFSLGDIAVYPNWSLIGFMYMFGALFADGIIGNVQEVILRDYKISETEMALYTNAIGTLVLLFINLLNGELFSGMAFAMEHPTSILYIFAFASCGFFGYLFVLACIRKYGAFVAVSATSTRKFFSIVFSFIIFRKPFHPKYIYGSILVFSSIGMHILKKYVKSSSSPVLPR